MIGSHKLKTQDKDCTDIDCIIETEENSYEPHDTK